MIGKVIEGRYVGASICKFPEKNVLFIETEDGERIALSKKNAISIDDVTDHYPSYGGKVMMVMWNDFETSIIQLGKTPSSTANESAMPHKNNTKKEIFTEKQRPFVKILFLLLIVIAVVGGLLITIKNLSNKGSNIGVTGTSSQKMETRDFVTESTIASETTASTGGNADSKQKSHLQYTWNYPITLNMPLADVKVGMYKNSSEYWIEFSCDTMDTEDFLVFLIDSTDDWGFDRVILAEWMSKVFRSQDKVWSEGNIGYSSMEGYGIKWTAYGDVKDDNRCVVGLKVNKLNEFEAVCNADIIESTELNSTTIEQQDNTLAEIQTYSVEEILLMNGNYPENEFYIEGYVFSHAVVQMGDGAQRGYCTLYPSLSSLPSLMESNTLANDVGDYIRIGHNVSEIDNVLTQMMAMHTGDWVKLKCINTLGFEFTLISIENDSLLNENASSDIPSVLYDETGRLRKADEFIEIYDTILSTAYKRYYGKTLSIRKAPGSQLSNSYGIYIDGEPSSAMINFMYKGNETPADNSYDQIIFMTYTDSGDENAGNIFCITTLMASAKPTVSDVMDSTSIFEEMLYELNEPGVDFSEYTVQGVKYKMSILPVENRPTMIFSIDISALQ